MVAVVALLAAQAYAANAATTLRPGVKKSAPRSIGSVQTLGPVRLADPGKMLPDGWQHSSDEAVTVVGDGTGLHVLAASEASGYAWKAVATLGDPTVQTDLWIGQACVTASGNSAVVVYAPEQVTNLAGAQGVLGHAAVVNLKTGAVKDLGGGFSVAYFDPGCGTGNTAVLTEGGWANDTGRASASTTLAVVNTTAGKIESTVRVPGQITSATPYQGQIAAAGGSGLEEINSTGATRLLAATGTVPYQLTPDASGGLGYQTVTGQRVDLWRLADGRAHQVASAAKGSVELHQTGGRVWLVGPDASKVHGLPAQWQAVDAPATATPSTTGTLVVTNSGSLTPAKGKKAAPGTAQPTGINVQLLGGSRRSASFEVPTTAAPTTSAEVTASAGTRARDTHTAAASAGSPTTPVSDDRTCAIPVDDPQIQAYQPTFQQVEWAADEAAQGTLSDIRPAGLYGSSLESYVPSGMFPLSPVEGGGSLPAQVLLGVLTQESNLQQASVHVIQGQTSNPLTSFNWYGNWIEDDTDNTGEVNWANSDCGYGIAQITSGMCLAQGQNDDSQCEYQGPLPAQEQLAIAVDYQANIAAGAQLLVDDWNELWNDGIKPNNLSQFGDATDDPDYIDNWYEALWAYNSGLEPGTLALGNVTGCTAGPSCTDANGDWGLGYADNPINPAYPPDRPAFATSSPENYPAPGGATYSLDWDLSHPEYWPYQDKVLAYAFDSIELYDYSQGKDVQAYAYAAGDYSSPPNDLFCTSANDCDASGVDVTQATGPDACQLTGPFADHCWWNGVPQDSWQIVAETPTCHDCGIQALTYALGAPDPGAEPIASQFAQTCTESPLPSDAVIVGDGGQSALGCPGQDWTSQGSFTWNFASDSNGNYSSKIDFDQIGAGFGGHFWFGYTVPNNGTSVSSTVAYPGDQGSVIAGTWTPPSTVTGWTDVKVAIPSYGDDALDANYQVDPGGGQPGRNVQVNQALTAGTNTWVDLGDFYLGNGAHVTLPNVVPFNVLGLGLGVDITWDAMAFISVSNPQVNYVAMGDSFSSGEGLGPFLDFDGCDRSPQAYPMLVTLPGQDEPISQQTSDGFSFIACSGAETTGVAQAAINPVEDPNAYYNSEENPWNATGVTAWGYEQYDAPWDPDDGPVEGLQAANSDLSNSTALITISVGGNDARFAPIIQSCLQTALLINQECSANNYYLTQNLGNGVPAALDPEPLYQFEPQVISLLTAHLVQTYIAINAAAPSADIIVLGYPNLFPANPTASCDSGSWAGAAVSLMPDTQNMLNGFAADLDTAISNAVTQVQGDGVAIHFIDPTQAFTGHALCDSGTSWIQPLQASSNYMGSYHPTADGQAEYATLVNECLAGTLEC